MEKFFMEVNKSMPVQELRASRSISRVMEIAEGNASDTEIQMLKAEVTSGISQFAIGTETLLLISTGLGLVY
jgi:hypothetical protein